MCKKAVSAILALILMFSFVPVTAMAAEVDNAGNEQETASVDPEWEGVHEYVFAVVDLVNEERAKENLAPVTLDRAATTAAQVRAEEAKCCWSHTRPDGRKCFTALTEAGVIYRAAGENLAGRIATPEKVVQAWMDSPGHRKNIMNPRYSQIGIGYVADGNYWGEFFVG
ncbi:CAP domain-containing protein [Anaerotignum sp.]